METRAYINGVIHFWARERGAKERERASEKGVAREGGAEERERALGWGLDEWRKSCGGEKKGVGEMKSEREC